MCWVSRLGDSKQHGGCLRMGEFGGQWQPGLCVLGLSQHFQWWFLGWLMFGYVGRYQTSQVSLGAGIAWLSGPGLCMCDMSEGLSLVLPS